MADSERPARADNGERMPLAFAAGAFELVIRPGHDRRSIADVANPIEAAVALGEVEPLLQLVDTWWQEEFDWHPVEPPEREADVDIRIDAGVHRAIGLYLPPGLDNFPALPEPLPASVELRWRREHARLCLDRSVLRHDDRLRVGPGALVLLPATFDRVGAGTLHLANGHTVAVRFRDEYVSLTDSSLLSEPPPDRLPEMAPVSADTAQASAAGRAAGTPVLACYCEVRLELDRLLRASADVPLCSMPGSGSPARLVLYRSDEDRQQSVEVEEWPGRLTLVGDGLAVLIDDAVTASSDPVRGD